MNGRRLYEEIGGVEERYLQEAAYYYVRKKPASLRVLMIAAAVTVAGAILLCTLAASVSVGVIGSMIRDEIQASKTPLAQMEKAMDRSQRTLDPRPRDQLRIFGTPRLIWSEIGSEEYYSIELSNNECRDLVQLMKKSRSTYTDQSEVPEYQIWLSFGDGVVVSPYLKNTAGNAGHGEVFDYDPELELGDALAEQIAMLIES